MVEYNKNICNVFNCPGLKPVDLARFVSIQKKAELEERDIWYMKGVLSKKAFEQFVREKSPKYYEQYIVEYEETSSSNSSGSDLASSASEFNIFSDLTQAALGISAPKVHLNIMVMGKRRVGKSSFVQSMLSYRYKSVQGVFENKLGEHFKEYTAVKRDDDYQERICLLDTPGYDPNSKESLEEWYEKIKDELIKRVGLSLLSV